MGLKIDRIRSFVAVAEADTYEEAAKRLGIAQPTVWKHVKDLREELNVELFRAGTVQLTRDGEELLRVARRLLKDEEELERLADDLGMGVNGVVKIACYPAHVKAFIAEVSGRFKHKHPDVRIELAGASQQGTAGRELIEKLLNSEVDLAVGQRTPDDPPFPSTQLDGRKIYEVRLVVVLPDNDPDRYRPTFPAEKLTSRSLLLPPAGYFTRIHVDRVCREKGFDPEVAAESGAWMALLAMGRSGVGTPIVPDDALDVPDDSRYPALVDARGQQIVKELWLLWRKNEPLPRTVWNFIQFVHSFCDARDREEAKREASRTQPLEVTPA